MDVLIEFPEPPAKKLKNWLLRPWKFYSNKLKAWNMFIPSPSPVQRLLPSVIS